MTQKKDYLLVNGIRLYYEIYGNGKPLVMIHGGGGSILHDFELMIQFLEKDFQLIGIDLQNHGRSEHREIPQTFEQDADDVIAVLEQLNIARASFFGFSNGGNTIIQIAHRNPEMVEKLIIASAFFKREGMIPGFFDGFDNATLEMMPASLQQNFLNLNPDRSKLQNMFDKDSQRMKHFKNWDENILKNISAPTLIINSDRDVVLNSHAVKMSELIPDCRLMILPASHGSYMMADLDGNLDKTQIEFTAQVIIHFLQSPD